MLLYGTKDYSDARVLIKKSWCWTVRYGTVLYKNTVPYSTGTVLYSQAFNNKESNTTYASSKVAS